MTLTEIFRHLAVGVIGTGAIYLIVTALSDFWEEYKRMRDEDNGNTPDDEHEV